MPMNIAILGSTGSIGRNALEVIAASQGRLRAVALTAHRNIALLREQAKRFEPACVVITDETAADSQSLDGFPPTVQVLVGPEEGTLVARRDDVDTVVSAVVGSAGLRGTWAALDAGKRVALANKESLVMGGELVRDLISRRGAQLFPIDSEHSAIFQALQCGRASEVRRVILTASGGPFRDYTEEELQNVTIEEALNHPTWSMGRKITIDSATMMNKALEIIEARWLFDLRHDQISVVIHPQSIVHSMVEYVDGSVIAQMSPPDMRLPIQLALNWPERVEGVATRFDWSEAHSLTFTPPDLERFDAINLGLEVARLGGSAGAVLNGANEAAVAAFLDKKLEFQEIVPACRAVLEEHDFEPHPSLEALYEYDRWARNQIEARWRIRSHPGGNI